MTENIIIFFKYWSTLQNCNFSVYFQSSNKSTYHAYFVLIFCRILHNMMFLRWHIFITYVTHKKCPVLKSWLPIITHLDADSYFFSYFSFLWRDCGNLSPTAFDEGNWKLFSLFVGRFIGCSLDLTETFIQIFSNQVELNGLAFLTSQGR